MDSKGLIPKTLDRFTSSRSLFNPIRKVTTLFVSTILWNLIISCDQCHSVMLISDEGIVIYRHCGLPLSKVVENAFNREELRCIVAARVGVSSSIPDLLRCGVEEKIFSNLVDHGVN